MLKLRKYYCKISFYMLRHYKILFILCMMPLTTIQSFAAVKSMWVVADEIIKNVYTQIAALSTVLAGLMSAVAVIGAKMSSNQHKIEQSWDWLKRIWIAWAVINGIGAFISYIQPYFSGLDTITP